MDTANNKSANQILLEAASILEEEGRWNKGFFFEALKNKPGCAMCAHGAIAYCGNPEVRINADKGMAGSAGAATKAASLVTGKTDTTFAFKDYCSNLAYKEGLSVENWLVKHYGQTGLAHYKAAQVGLTFAFNDDPSTTQKDVVRKLREAAATEKFSSDTANVKFV